MFTRTGFSKRRSFSDGPGGSFSTISCDKETRRATSSESSFEGETFEVSGGSGVLVEDRGHPIPVVLGYTDGRVDMNRVQSLIKRMLGDFMRRNDTYPGRIKSFGEVTENLLQIQYLPNDINEGPSSSTITETNLNPAAPPTVSPQASSEHSFALLSNSRRALDRKNEGGPFPGTISDNFANSRMCLQLGR